MINNNVRTIDYKPLVTGVISFIIALAISFVLTSGIVILAGFKPLEVFWYSLSGGFGSLQRLGLTMNEAAPLLFCTLGLIVAFRAGIWNIGAEGQLYIGAVGATITGLYITGLSKIPHLIIVAIASIIFGALFGALPGYLKTRFNANEIITSLLLNFVAIWFVGYLVRFPMVDPGAYIPVSDKIQESARLPLIFKENPAHIGIIIAIVCAVLVWFLYERTLLGYRFKAIGSNINTALFGGINVKVLIVLSMAISGGLAGLAGMSQVSGVHFVLSGYLSPAQYGFFAIPIVFIARLNPFGAIITCIFFGGLLTGAKFVQLTLGIDPTVISIFLALIMLTLMLGPFLEKRLKKIMFKS